MADAPQERPAISFSVPGAPQGKMRPGKRRVGKFIQHYQPEKDASYEAKIGWYCRASMRGAQAFGLRVPLRVVIRARFAPPAGWSARKRGHALAGIHRPTGKPDGDNLCKIVGDALNSVAWADDAQVVEWIISKTYAEVAALLVEIWEVAPPDMLQPVHRPVRKPAPAAPVADLLDAAAPADIAPGVAIVAPVRGSRRRGQPALR